MEKIHVFLDESGAFGFNFKSTGCTSHFIVAAVLVRESELNDVTASVELIRDKYFPNGEIKSSRIKNKFFRKRIEILKELMTLPIHIALLVVDKRLIPQDNYLRKDKKTFYKFFYQQIYSVLISKIKDISIHPDEVGGTQDLEEFKRYYYRKSDKYSLFHDIDFAFDDSKNSLIVQVADLFAGSIAKNIDTTKISPEDTTDY